MLITLTTDFGTADAYVAQMKGVIESIAPGTSVIDISHDVPAQDVVAGALMLEHTLAAFPEGTIHVGVIDPGVGSARRAIVVRTEHATYIAPDNGLLTAVLQRTPAVACVSLTNPAYHRASVSRTFHGRDVFTPAAAHLAAGTPFDNLGDPITDPAMLDLPTPRPTDAGLELHVIHIDHFGNLITDATAADLDASPDAVTLTLGDHVITGIHTTFADVAPGEPVAYLGSSNHLEIAIRNGSAAARYPNIRSLTLTARS